MVVAEALTVSTPVLSTDVGSISNVVINGFNDFCVRLGSSKELYASKIEAILENISIYCDNALTSSKVFDASKVYAVIHNDIKNVVK